MMILLILVCTHELSIGITFFWLDKLIKLICMQGPQRTPQLASQGRGVLPGIPGGVTVPSGSPNFDPISDQKM